MTAQTDDAARLQEVCRSFYGGEIDRNAVRSGLIDIVVARLGCARVSLWKFDPAGDPTTLLCFASKAAGGELDTSERRLERTEYEDYFNVLIERGVFVAEDAMSEPALQPMREHYLVANHVLSMLDAAFMLNGRAFGMVCCEETDVRRDWRAGEVMALRAIVGRLAMLMSSYDDEMLWHAPSLPLQPLPSSRETRAAETDADAEADPDRRR